MITFKFTKSNRKDKKYMAILSDGRIVHFGSLGYQQYYDNTGLNLYKNYNHQDKKKRMNYRKRHSKILTGLAGQVTSLQIPSYLIKYSPAWFSWNYLW